MKDRASGQSKVISIVAGGVLSRRFLPSIRAASVIVGVDRGALWLIDNGVTPDVAIGDFDSVSVLEKRRIHDSTRKYIEYPPEKDVTDLELAAEAVIPMKPSEVNIYGATGKRFDHAMGAIHVLQKLVSHNIMGVIVDNFNKINIVRRQQILTHDGVYLYVSVIPFGSNAIVSLKGFRYDVSKTKFSFGFSLGISNEIVAGTASVHVHQGMVLVVQSTD